MSKSSRNRMHIQRNELMRIALVNHFDDFVSWYDDKLENEI